MDTILPMAAATARSATSPAPTHMVTSIASALASDARLRAAVTMVLAWQTSREPAAERGPHLAAGSLMSAAMRHAGGLTEGEALVTAADHATAVRRMDEAIDAWRGPRGSR